MNQSNNFICKSRNLANFLIKYGSTLIDSYYENGICVFEFKYDKTINENVDLWEANKKRWLF